MLMQVVINILAVTDNNFHKFGEGKNVHYGPIRECKKIFKLARPSNTNYKTHHLNIFNIKQKLS